MRKLLLAAILLLANIASGQIIQLHPHSGKLGDFIRLEKKLGGALVESKTNHISARGIAQPLIFRRKEKEVPDLLVYYFYYEQDSAISYLLYEWDDLNFTGYTENAKKTDTEVARFIEKYNQLYAEVVSTYGKSVQKGDLTDLSLIDKSMDRSDTWKVGDSTEIELYTSLSNRYEKKGPVTINPTHRIRLYVRNTKRDSGLLRLSDTKVRLLDAASQRFFSAMKERNLGQARSQLSAQVSSGITDAQLEQLAQFMRFENLALFSKSVEIEPDGLMYYMLEYRHAEEIDDPKEKIKVILGDNNKILGLQPLKRD